jgi:hypothetical protein
VTELIDQSPASRGTVYYRIRAYNRIGTSRASSVGSNAWTGNGLRGEYFNDTSFATRTVSRIDRTIDFEWDISAPDARVNADNFAVRWTGQVQPRYSESYTFTALSDDGVRVWIDGRQIINNWQNQAPTEASGTIELVAGRKYDIRVEYYDGAAGATMRLFWQSASQTREIIPQSQLYAAP